MQEREFSCPVITPINVDCDGNRIQVPTKSLSLTDVIDGKEVPPDKLRAMQDYAKLLRKKFPHMKESRLSRKVAEHFKIKLV